ncbi:hypothetical protein [Gordonia sp. (in: high G+C Gram-positive bacteria)]|uniref:hypothetical protein n=1 Tax=Gordonia sp. (in: high G+C Gram-positive bacteria) TaxID=84139 RepID=UPI00257D2CA3|nr:hypothetical protein [Gordonia sp. (in: high G+C Gram-positive bacteria)]
MQGEELAYARLEQVLGWVAWIACLLAVGRLIWIGALFWQAKRQERGDVGIDNLVGQLIGVVLVASSGAIAGALLS